MLKWWMTVVLFQYRNEPRGVGVKVEEPFQFKLVEAAPPEV